MAQKTAWDGAALTESDINTYLMGEGGAWTSYTPTIDQGASTNIAKTVNVSSYGRWGRMIVWQFTLTLTASGSAGSGVTLTLPVTAANANGIGGSGRIYDSSAATTDLVFWGGFTTSSMVAWADASTGSSWGAAPSIALASSDILVGTVIYQAAS
jgi:hypothetical protein